MRYVGHRQQQLDERFNFASVGLIALAYSLTKDAVVATRDCSRHLVGRQERVLLSGAPKALKKEILVHFTGKYDFWRLHKANFKKYYEYGPIFIEKFNNELEMVLIYDPKDVANLYRNEGRYPDRKIVDSFKKYRDTKKDIYNKGGLLTTNGPEWWEVRSQTQPHMMKPKAIEAYMEAMDEVAKCFTDRMAYLRANNGGEVPDYLNELYKWSLESVSLVALDTRLGCIDPNPNPEGVKMIQVVNDVFSQIFKLEFGALNLWKRFPSPTYRKFEKNMDYFSSKATKHLEEAKMRLLNAPEDHEPTFLELMISTTKDYRDLHAMITDMLFAGVDSTSNTVGFTLYHLARNPRVQEKVYEEIKSYVKGGPVTKEVISNLRYLKACVKESMRLNPIAIGNARTLSEDTVMSGYAIPAGTRVFSQQYVMGQLEKYFSDPKTFRPERFLRNETEHDPFAFLPFGFGPRQCIGRRIAEQEIWTLLIRVIERFRLEYKFEDIDMYIRGLGVPDKPLRFNFYDR